MPWLQTSPAFSLVVAVCYSVLCGIAIKAFAFDVLPVLLPSFFLARLVVF